MVLRHNWVAKHGPVQKPQYYMTTSNVPKRGSGNGVVLIMKQPPHTTISANFPTDVIHVPGMVGVRTVNNTVVANVHFVSKITQQRFYIRMRECV